MGQVPDQFAHYFSNAGSYSPNGINYNRVVNFLAARGTKLSVEPTVATPIEFPDVSYYQGTINWDVMSSKTKNIIIRAGQNLWVDSAFQQNWTAAKQRGMSRGCYWFYDDRVSPQQQFDVLKPLIENDQPEDRIWVDWELVYGGQYGGLKNVVAFMKLIEQAFPSKIVGMYTGYYFFIDHSNPINNAAEYEYLKVHPLWIASYTSDGSSTGILIPKPWTVPELHQFGTPVWGHDFGCESLEIDMNRVIYDPSQIYGQGDPMVTTPVTIQWYELQNAGALNIRNTPGSTAAGTDIGDIPLEGIVLVKEYTLIGTTKWYHLIDGRMTHDLTSAPIQITDGHGAISNCPDCWASGTYLRGTNIPVPNPEPPVGTPPVKVTVQQADGSIWECTTFTRI